MADDTEQTTADSADGSAMVAVFSSSNYDAELEALAVKGVLDSSGIPAIVVGAHTLPNLEFQVQVPAELLDSARQIIRDARQGGRKAAAEGEAATER